MEGKLKLSACNAQVDRTTTLSEDLTDYQKLCRKRWAVVTSKSNCKYVRVKANNTI